MTGNKASTIIDINQAGGRIINGASSVLVNGNPIGIHPSPITPHGKKKHAAAVTTQGSPDVFAEGKPVLRVTSGNDCGHSIVTGSNDVNVS